MPRKKEESKEETKRVPSKEETEEKVSPKEETEEKTKKGVSLEKETEEKKEEKITETVKKTIEEKKKELLERAKKVSEKIESTTTDELKEKIKKKKAEFLLPLEDYVRSGIYIGTRAVTPDMKPFVYRRRADGLAIFNTDLINEKIKEAIEYLVQFNPEDIIVVCKRPAGWKAVKMFSKITGIEAFTKEYPAGMLTNIQLDNFREVELAIICDSWVDKNAIHDMKKINKPFIMICDTNNFTHGAERVIIGNNKSSKSLGLIFYLLAKEYCKARKIDAKIPDLDWWMEEIASV